MPKPARLRFPGLPVSASLLAVPALGSIADMSLTAVLKGRLASRLVAECRPLVGCPYVLLLSGMLACPRTLALGFAGAMPFWWFWAVSTFE